MRNLCFARQFLKYPKQIGTFTQSSRALARKIAQQIDGSVHVLEFGAGAGCVTTEILRRLPAHGRLTCFEINPEFCRHLRAIRDPRLTVINDSALNCRLYVGRWDCVVSGLPLTLFTQFQKQQILDISGESKTYIQLQYTPVMMNRIKSYFSRVRLIFVPQNFPPAFIYVCNNLAKPARYCRAQEVRYE